MTPSEMFSIEQSMRIHIAGGLFFCDFLLPLFICWCPCSPNSKDATFLSAGSGNCPSLGNRRRTPMFWCWHCFMLFQNEVSRTRHRRFHIGKPFKCFQCSKPFRETWELLQHSHVDSAHHWFKCGTCFKAFRQRYELEDHMDTHMGKVKKKVNMHQCPSCPKTFVGLPSLKKHMTSHLGLGPYACAPFRRGFRTMAELNDHRTACPYMEQGIHFSHFPEVTTSCKTFKNPHGTQLRTYLSKRSKDNSHLESTGSPEDSGDSSTFQCHLCPEEFAGAEVLKDHLSNHVEEMPYKCSLCPKMFTRSIGLNAHLRFHESNRDFVLEARRVRKKVKRNVDLK